MAKKKKISDNINEALDDAKEGAKEFADSAKESAKEFVEDAKEVLSEGKNIAIIAHLTPLGWLIALIMNNPKKELGSFYIRQTLGIWLLWIILGLIPVLGWLVFIVMVILWLLSLVGAFAGENKPTPGLGEHFQNWFNSL